jgi:hypothetical protein
MAKFTNKDLRLKDGQKVTWGTDLDANMWYDGAADQLSVDVTISGVDPTEDYHLTTRYYVDDQIATTSGSLQDQLDDLTLDHGGLEGLADDDHTQYILVDGSRGFTNTVSGVDPTQPYHLATKDYIDQELATVSGGIVQDHGGLTGLGDDDHTQYILVNGTRAFTSTVGGVTPTDPTHLTTKDYVDAAIQGLDWQESVIDFWTPSAGLPATPNLGDRYVADDSGNGWVQNNVYTWDGTQWDEVAANDGMSAWFEDEDVLFVYAENPTTSGWVRFGSTITHNNTNGLQGGTANEYYHLRQAEYYALAYNGNNSIDDASGQHHHDSRYYTETEIDATVSGLEADINTYSDHGALSGLGDDDHSQYTLADGTRAFTGTVAGITPTLDAHLTTKLYVDGEVATVSGAIDSHVSDASIHFTEASIDHGSIAGLGDDDHTQYILVDGTRGFTATVSGVTPTQDYHLATKAYVDGADQPQQHGRQVIADGASTVTVNFTDVGSTNYTVSVTLENTADSPPSIYPFIVSGKTSSSFTVTFAGDMDSANYYIDWIIIED